MKFYILCGSDLVNDYLTKGHQDKVNTIRKAIDPLEDGTLVVVDEQDKSLADVIDEVITLTDGWGGCLRIDEEYYEEAIRKKEAEKSKPQGSVDVFFEAKTSSIHIATFANEALYNFVYPLLEDLAKNRGYKLTETINQ